jgi:DNA-binding transcriptional MerR regulator
VAIPSNSRDELPPIPAKRYFTIGEVSELCGVKPHVLRYWEQEFTQLRPVKRRGNRRYYQHHEVMLARRIRELLYQEGFTISGARLRLNNAVTEKLDLPTMPLNDVSSFGADLLSHQLTTAVGENSASVRQELNAIIDFLRADDCK